MRGWASSSLLVSAVAVFVACASGQTCADESCAAFAVTDLATNRECFDFEDDAGTAVGFVCLITKNDSQFNFIFRTLAGYEITSARGGVTTDCAAVPGNNSRFQRIRNPPGIDRTTLVVPFDEVAAADGCCENTLCFLFEAEIQESGSPGTSGVYTATTSEATGCSISDSGVVVCERTLVCDGCADVPPTGDTPCTDDKRAPLQIDTGCSAAFPYCDSGDRSNDGDDAEGTVCRVCQGRGSNQAVDFQCTPTAPDCVDSAGSEVGFRELGDACVCLLTDADCPAGQTANTDRCICSSGPVDDICTDTAGGGAVDDGCSIDFPYCDSGDERNDGDGAAGAVCRFCLGRGRNAAVDFGCNDATPDCVNDAGEEVAFSVLGDSCVCLLSASDCATNEIFAAESCECVDNGGEEICTDTAGGGATDTGCTAALPYCDSGDGTNDGDAAGGAVCRLCVGRGRQQRVDFGCLENTPDCIDASGDEVVFGQLGDACVCLLTQADCEADEVVNRETCLCEPEGNTSICTDNLDGTAIDSGCSVALPYCDSGDRGNDGDGADGDVCRRCLGRGVNARVDWNCQSALPDCVTSAGAEVLFGQLGDECVCLLTQADCAANEVVDLATCMCEPEGNTSICTDNLDGTAIDSGCSVALPYCDSGDRGNDGDGADGDVCRRCLGRGVNARVDWNCQSALPDCVTSAGAEALFGQLGDECVCLLTQADCAANEVVDPATCMCEPDGTTSICNDTLGGRGIDSGCSVTLPYCDSGDRGNDGDGAAGDVCRLCLGRGVNARIDRNCQSATPDCVTSDGTEVLFGQLGDQCVCLLTNEDCPTGQFADDATCLCSGCSLTCVSPEVLDEEACECGCGLVAGDCTAPEVLNSTICACECGLAASDCAAGTILDSEACECVSTCNVTCFQPEVLNVTECACECGLVAGDCGAGTTLDSDACECVGTCNVTCTPPEVLNATACACECGLTADDCTAGTVLNPDTCTCAETCDLTCIGNEILNEDQCICECPLVASSCTSPQVLLEAECACGCDVQCLPPGILDSETCDCVCAIGSVGDCNESEVFNPVTCQCDCLLGSCTGQEILTDDCACVCPDSVEASCEAPQAFSAATCDCVCGLSSADCSGEEIVNSTSCECECPTVDPCSGSTSLNRNTCTCECSLTDADCGANQFADTEACDCACQTTADDCEGFEQFAASLCFCFCPSTAADAAECEANGQEFRESLCDCCGFAFTQVGADLDGIRAGDKFGSMVTLSADGSKLAATSPTADGYWSEGAGHVRVYQDAWGVWVPFGQSIDGYVQANEGTNIHMSDDGTRLIIGYPKGGEDKLGSVRVFSMNYGNGMWEQMGDTIMGNSAGGHFGEWVSISGDGQVIAVGEPLNSEREYYGGKVQIWEHVHGAWKRLGADFVSSAENAFLGYPVIMSQDGLRVAFSSYGSSEHVENGGKVQVYDYNTTANAWQQVGKDLVGMTSQGLAGVGLHMTPDGSRLVFGTSSVNCDCDNAGLAQVYEEVDGSWVQVGDDLEGEAAYDYAGVDVKISADGNRVFLSSKNATGRNGTKNVGHVRLFNLVEGEWLRVAPAIEGEAEGDHMGDTFAINHEGTRVAVGAHLNDGEGEDAGHVRVFELTFIPCEPTEAPVEPV